MHSIRKKVFRAVSEPIRRFTGNDAHLQKIGEVAVEGYFAEAYDDANARQSLNLIGKMRGAVANLLREGLIPRRRTADDRSYPGVAQFKTVVARDASWLAGKA